MSHKGAIVTHGLNQIFKSTFILKVKLSCRRFKVFNIDLQVVEPKPVLSKKSSPSLRYLTENNETKSYSPHIECSKQAYPTKPHFDNVTFESPSLSTIWDGQHCSKYHMNSFVIDAMSNKIFSLFYLALQEQTGGIIEFSCYRMI